MASLIRQDSLRKLMDVYKKSRSKNPLLKFKGLNGYNEQPALGKKILTYGDFLKNLK
jgi:hypothetical protein